MKESGGAEAESVKSEVDTGKKDTRKEDRYNWIEIGSAVLLSLAMIVTAWCAYQSARWSGLQAISFSSAASCRNKSAAWVNLAGQETLIDVDLFLEYISLYAQSDILESDLDLYEEHLFSERLTVAIDAWLATNPLENPDAPRNPFEMPEYVNSEMAIGLAFMNLAEIHTQDAKDNNQQSDNYVLLTVIFAIVLFFAGICTKFKKAWLKLAVLSFGGIIFYVTALMLSFQSVH